MTTTVYFIRHAEPNYQNHDDISRELTPRGLQSAQDLVERFKTIQIDSFYSSPFKRSIDTILPLAKSKRIAIQIVDNFRERKIGPVWISDFESFCKQQWEDFTYCLENGENLADVQQRNVQALKHILQIKKDKTIIIGTHGTALSTILNYYQPNFSYEDFQTFKHVFPWIVKLEFHNLTLLSITQNPLLERNL